MDRNFCVPSFQNFLRFSHCSSSPHYSQSNGKVKSAVKIAKMLFKKSHADSSEFMLTLLDWRNSPPHTINISPVQRLMSKRSKSMLLMDSSLLNPKVVDNMQNRRLRKREQSKTYYDRSRRPSCTLKEGDVDRV